jgi:hypothetical protein
MAEPDPHAEMAAALAAQVDAHPAPAVLPIWTGSLRTAAVPAKPGAVAHPTASTQGQRAANQASDQASMQAHAQQAAPASLVRQAQAASAAVAGQTQAAAAKDRASHPHPTSPRR